MDKLSLVKGKVSLELIHLVTVLQLQELVIQSHQQIQRNQLRKILSEAQVQYHEKTLLVGILIQCRSGVAIQVKVI